MDSTCQRRIEIAWLIAWVLLELRASPSQGLYLGCFRDYQDGRRAMNDNFNEDIRMSVDKCRGLCLASVTHFTYFGVQFSSQCFCGEQYSTQGSRPESDCSYKCRGNNQQRCGGSNAMSVHTVCEPGFFGANCTNRCHCAHREGHPSPLGQAEICPRSSGACLAVAACQEWWEGPSCSKDSGISVTFTRTRPRGTRQQLLRTLACSTHKSTRASISPPTRNLLAQTSDRTKQQTLGNRPQSVTIRACQLTMM